MSNFKQVILEAITASAIVFVIFYVTIAKHTDMSIGESLSELLALLEASAIYILSLV